MFVAGKFWEILSYVFVVVMYWLTRRKFHKQVQCIFDDNNMCWCVFLSLIVCDVKDYTIVNLRQEIYINKRTIMLYISVSGLRFYKGRYCYRHSLTPVLQIDKHRFNLLTKTYLR